MIDECDRINGEAELAAVVGVRRSLAPRERGIIAERRPTHTNAEGWWRAGHDLRCPPMASALIVSTLHISEGVRAKLEDKHDLDAVAVRAVVEGVGKLPFRWARHKVTGTVRALVQTAIDGESILVILYPSRSGDAEEWHLGSAYPDFPET